jgi:hypothetical protein
MPRTWHDLQDEFNHRQDQGEDCTEVIAEMLALLAENPAAHLEPDPREPRPWPLRLVACAGRRIAGRR